MKPFSVEYIVKQGEHLAAVTKEIFESSVDAERYMLKVYKFEPERQNEEVTSETESSDAAQ